MLNYLHYYVEYSYTSYLDDYSQVKNMLEYNGIK